ncbi:RagB/SusD family nutrient uptake outer membrane protein [Chitinophaga sp. Ak27]|uniref:RagB/SusD family nutrient uptake outer membrane protein n=1 Tax=Chitinophaga sp. Ak27 TaxID=2726116 RepID=UPI00145C3A50|nr:RagB/SusD family nutrient uptake outer membrane protein [Chitinophaga sp. Ak27]NLU90485.1 RagB/SusD family nutrient uptake outer membrane protein [Chitinophaga sp. Ak27]
MIINKFILPLAIVTVSFVSCKKDFLNRTPETSISDEDYWKTTNDLRLYTNRFYNQLPSYIKQFFTLANFSMDDEQGSDNMINRNYSTFLNGEFTLPPSGAGWSSGDWAAIRSVNYFLGKYESVTGDQTAINKYLGEALFFKASYYFDKLRKFGDLPWLPKALSTNDSTILYAPRVSRSIIADSIIILLDNAISLLPAKGDAANGYEDLRVYKELAALLQSRIALYEGTWEKYHANDVFGVKGADGSKYLAKAVTAAQLVMSNPKLGLDNVGQPNGYWNLFNQLSYAGSKEIMLWRQYNAQDGNVTYISTYMTGGGGRGISKSLVESYLCTDGQPISVSPLYKGDANLINVAANRDPRLAQTIQINDGWHYISDTSRFWHPAWGGAAEDRDYTGYQIYKGLNTSSAQHIIGSGTQGIIYYRYAEALLNYIEAKAELGQAAQADVDMSVNLLRRRVGMPDLIIANITNDPNWLFPSLSPLINEIRRERRVELAVEGYRHDDIWRWAAADKLIKGWNPKGAKRSQFLGIPNGSGGNFDATLTSLYPVDEYDYITPYKNNVVGTSGYDFKTDRDYLSPIPTDQLILNPNLNPQNPGW